MRRGLGREGSHDRIAKHARGRNGDFSRRDAIWFANAPIRNIPSEGVSDLTQLRSRPWTKKVPEWLTEKPKLDNTLTKPPNRPTLRGQLTMARKSAPS